MFKSFHSKFEFLRALPLEIRIFFTEVTESSSLLVDGSAEVEFLDDVHGSEVEVVQDDLGELLVR